MKVKFLPCFVFTLFILFFSKPQGLHAQCSNRYIDSLFTVDTTFNVIYTTTAGGGTDTLLMDVYQPHGDTAALRHLIVWAHGGAFFEGTKNDNDIQVLCTTFAQRGYVCASINYRLAPSILNLYDSISAFGYMMKSVNDMKSSIRFFRKDAAANNTYRIDSNMIFGAGNSAGAIMIDLAVTIDSVGETPPYFQAVMDSNGGINGNSGNDGYSSKVVCVASLAGSIDELSWVSPGNPPMICAQGTADPIVPYGCDYVFHGYTLGLVKTYHMCGSEEIVPQLASLGIRNSLLPFPGDGHVPWDNDATKMKLVDSAVAAFFYTQTCTLNTSVPELNNESEVVVYPNPASNQLNIKLPKANNYNSGIAIVDLAGRIIFATHSAADNQITTIATSSFASGMYIVRIQGNEQSVNRKVYISN